MQKFPFGRRLLLSGVIGVVLGITGATTSALEELDIDGKEDLWKGSHEIRIHTDFKCGDMKATFEAEMSEAEMRKGTGVRIVTAAVNGKKIPETLIKNMQDEIRLLGYFDYVNFICAGDNYGFTLGKWEANKPEPTRVSLWGKLKDLEP